MESLAAAGALASLGVDRREALWAAGALAGEYGRRRLRRNPHGRARPQARPAQGAAPREGARQARRVRNLVPAAPSRDGRWRPRPGPAEDDRL